LRFSISNASTSSGARVLSSTASASGGTSRRLASARPACASAAAAPTAAATAVTVGAAATRPATGLAPEAAEYSSGGNSRADADSSARATGCSGAGNQSIARP
jgi:hypothetical protein